MYIWTAIPAKYIYASYLAITNLAFIALLVWQCWARINLFDSARDFKSSNRNAT